MRRFVFRVDSSITIGTGHVYRCRVLARLLKKSNAEVIFVCRSFEGNLINLLSKEFEVLSLPSPASQKTTSNTSYSDWLCCSQSQDASDTLTALSTLNNPRIDALIVDHYSIDIEWESHFRANYLSQDNFNDFSIIVIDDLANRSHECDLLLDPNYFGDNTYSRYSKLVASDCKLALGPHYALLDPEFSLARKALSRSTYVRRVLLFFGGNDFYDLTTKVLRTLLIPKFSHIYFDIVIGSLSSNRSNIHELCAEHDNACIHEDLPNLADLMTKSDLYIGSGGTTTWERCCLSLRSLVITSATNQIELTKVLHESSDICYIGHANSVTSDQILTAFESNLDLLDHSKASHFTDGLGAFRICLSLLNQKIDVRIRQAVLDDLSLFWRWANDSIVRSFSFSPSYISFSSHSKWFKQGISSSSRLQLVSYDYSSNIPLGQVRFDLDQSQNIISIDISVEVLFRGLGLSYSILKSSLLFSLDYFSSDCIFEARILNSNSASKTLFSRLGFSRSAIHDHDSFQVWRLPLTSVSLP